MEDGIKQLIDMVANLKVTMLDKFEDIDKRFEEMDKRFEEIDKRFEAVDKRFDGVDKRFDGIEIRLDRIENKLKEHDKRFDKIEEKFINSLKLIGHDVQNNKRHIEKLENNDDYYNVSE